MLNDSYQMAGAYLYELKDNHAKPWSKLASKNSLHVYYIFRGKTPSQRRIVQLDCLKVPLLLNKLQIKAL
jgi:hypothetical protein